MLTKKIANVCPLRLKKVLNTLYTAEFLKHIQTSSTIFVNVIIKVETVTNKSWSETFMLTVKMILFSNQNFYYYGTW